MIDGEATKSNKNEMLYVSPEDQLELSIECVDIINADKTYLVTGTGYHTGKNVDYENVIGQRINAEKNMQRGIKFAWLHETLSLNVDGLKFDFCHKVGRSSIPHGRWTPLARQELWDLKKAGRARYEGHDIFVRSHTHYHIYGGEYGKLMLTTPALQGHTRFGQREVEGVVDVGITYFDVENKENFEWGTKLVDPVFLKRVEYIG